MGLAGPKTRFKISRDPNNTNWSRDTDRFGHRILTSQGWVPGTHLGSQTSSHAQHHTAASYSHVRVLLKDDNLGLGAKRGSERAENFGMAGFDDLLARLNGKSEEKILEQKGKRRDADMKVFVSQRWGTMMFVSGGFLVGDQIVKGKKGEIPQGGGKAEEAEPDEGGRPAKEKTKKRKRREVAEDDGILETIAENEEQEPRLKKKKRKSNLRAEASAESLLDVVSSKKEKKSKRSRHEKSSKSSKKRKSSDDSDSDSASAAKEESAELTRKRLKAEKKASKLAEKKSSKDLKKAARAAEKAEKAARKEAKRLKKSKSTTSLPTPASTSSSASPAPASEPTASATTSDQQAFATSARHSARRRYILAKRSAIMDPQALREIFMVKSTG